MKSLEIINDGLNYIEISDVSKAPITRVDLETIKQDLEVLEQIKALHTERYIHQSDDGNYYPIQNIYGSVRPRIHTKLGKIEDILEQWLEENENE